MSFARYDRVHAGGPLRRAAVQAETEQAVEKSARKRFGGTLLSFEQKHAMSRRIGDGERPRIQECRIREELNVHRHRSGLLFAEPFHLVEIDDVDSRLVWIGEIRVVLVRGEIDSERLDLHL